MAKRKRVLTLEVPAGTSPQDATDLHKWLLAKLAEAGHTDVVILPLGGGAKLTELFAPRAREKPELDRQRFIELSEAMYQELVQ